MDVMELEFSVETLATLGMRVPHHIIVHYGTGGNAKGARSRLRSRVYGDGHKWVPPSVFDKGLRDEFRNQGHGFDGAMFRTIREGHESDSNEKVFRVWTAGEGIGVACRTRSTRPCLNGLVVGKRGV